MSKCMRPYAVYPTTVKSAHATRVAETSVCVQTGATRAVMDLRWGGPHLRFNISRNKGVRVSLTETALPGGQPEWRCLDRLLASVPEQADIRLQHLFSSILIEMTEAALVALNTTVSICLFVYLGQCMQRSPEAN